MNANELRKELEEVLLGLKTGRIKPPVACEMNNAAGKIISLTKLELEYARLVKDMGQGAPKIALLSGGNEQDAPR